jgi:hypothetical protein
MARLAPQRGDPAPDERDAPEARDIGSGDDRLCQFELDNGAGATLRLHLVGYDAADVAALARSLWNAE